MKMEQIELKGVNHIAVIASDYDRSLRFYRDILGMSVISETYRAERQSMMTKLSLNGRYLIELFTFPNSPERPTNPEACGLRHLAFEVEDVDRVVNVLDEQAYPHEELRAGDKDERLFFVKDPDGLPIEIVERAAATDVCQPDITNEISSFDAPTTACLHDVCASIQRILLAKHKTLATAESCTSGRIAAELTKVAGASGYFQGGLVAYQDRIKVEMLGVDAQDIERYDVVSQEVATQMVRGACRLFGTDYALASTGYAGESNGRIPSGTIWIAWGSEDVVNSACLTTNIDRETNTRNAVSQLLHRFLNYLLGEEDKPANCI